jgi:ATP-dependent DNA helicase
MHSEDSSSKLLNKTSVVTSLHAILKPFLLRRLKVDVEKDLPPKKEYLLYAPLTVQQKDIYQAIVSGNIRNFLVDKKAAIGEDEPVAEPEQAIATTSTEQTGGRMVRKKARLSYKIEENDSKYLRDLEDGVRTEEPSGPPVMSAAEIGRKYALDKASE